MGLAQEVIVKDPDEIRKVDFDWTDSDDLATGETLSAVSSTSVTPAGELAISQTTVQTPKVQVTLIDGVAGKEYVVEVEVTTSNGQTLVGCGRVVVEECS